MPNEAAEPLILMMAGGLPYPLFNGSLQGAPARPRLIYQVVYFVAQAAVLQSVGKNCTFRVTMSTIELPQEYVYFARNRPTPRSFEAQSRSRPPMMSE